jgi:hypothetical protein
VFGRWEMLPPDIATAKAQKQLHIFSMSAVNTNFSQGAVQERPASILGL